jgi:hypothetical protein
MPYRPNKHPEKGQFYFIDRSPYRLLMHSLPQSIEVMSLLYAAALKAHTGDPGSSDFPESTVLNPTSGVSRQAPKGLAKLVFRKDPTRLGGGVFVADPSHGAIDTKGLPAGLVIVEAPTSATKDEGQQAKQQTLVPGNVGSSSGGRSSGNSPAPREYQVVPQAMLPVQQLSDTLPNQAMPIPGNLNVNPGINQIAENWAENGIEGMLNMNLFGPTFDQSVSTVRADLRGYKFTLHRVTG